MALVHAESFTYLTLSKKVPASMNAKIEKLFNSFPEAKYAIINSVSPQQRKNIFMGYPKSCFMRSEYDTCLVVNPKKVSVSDKMHIKVIQTGFKGFPITPYGFEVDGKYLFMIFTISKKEMREAPKIFRKIKNILEKTRERRGLEKENVFALGDFGLSPKKLSRATGLNVYLEEPNRIDEMQPAWVSNIMGMASKSYVDAKIDYNFPAKIYKADKKRFKKYAKDFVFLPFTITVPAKER